MIAPATAPNAVPASRSQETARAAPNDDCVITKVVIGAQYASGRRNNRAIRSEVTAVTAVRTECTRIGKFARAPLSHRNLSDVVKMPPRSVSACSIRDLCRVISGRRLRCRMKIAELQMRILDKIDVARPETRRLPI